MTLRSFRSRRNSITTSSYGRKNSSGKRNDKTSTAAVCVGVCVCFCRTRHFFSSRAIKVVPGIFFSRASRSSLVVHAPARLAATRICVRSAMVPHLQPCCAALVQSRGRNEQHNARLLHTSFCAAPITRTSHEYPGLVVIHLTKNIWKQLYCKRFF